MLLILCQPCSGFHATQQFDHYASTATPNDCTSQRCCDKDDTKHHVDGEKASKMLIRRIVKIPSKTDKDFYGACGAVSDLVRFPNPLFGVGWGNEALERGNFFFRGSWNLQYAS